MLDDNDLKPVACVYWPQHELIAVFCVCARDGLFSICFEEVTDYTLDEPWAPPISTPATVARLRSTVYGAQAAIEWGSRPRASNAEQKKYIQFVYSARLIDTFGAISLHGQHQSTGALSVYS
jgi:hypothetical protein